MNKIPVIISLTTTHYRINTLYKCLDSIAGGTILPEKIILYVSEEPYLLDRGIITIPDNLNKYNDLLEIKWVPNIGPHRKFFYSFQEFPEHLICIIDDDFIYPSNFLEVMYNESKNNTNCIISSWAKLITNENNYTRWTNSANISIGFHNNLYFGCGGGTLFNTKLIPHNNQLFNLDKILELTPSSSEMWLNFYFKYIQVNVYFIGSGLFNTSLVNIENSQHTSLMKYHRGNNWTLKLKIYKKVKHYFEQLDL
jgi:hypothetical protein